MYDFTGRGNLSKENVKQKRGRNLKSIWTRKIEIRKRETFRGERKTDVVVIGAGMAGVLTAYLLSQREAEVILLEGNRIGSGQTGNTTAKITVQHGLIYDKLINQFGEERAKQYAQANQRALSEYARLIEAKGIDCHFERKPAYVYTTGDTEPLIAEMTAAERLGISAAFVKETELPFPVEGAVRFENQAQFHPLEFLEAISESLTIYEKTMVQGIEGDKVITEGGVIEADAVVMTTHFPFINTPGYYFMRMHQERSCVLALKGVKPLSGMYIGADDESFSFRSYEDMLLLGGEGYRTGENSAGGRYEKLKKAAKEWYPESTEEAWWSAQDCMTLDGVPYIGRFSDSTPNLYVATGFQKWGMSSSMASAQILTDLILTGKSDVSDVFSPQRFNLSASAKNMVADGIQSVKGLGKGFFAGAEKQIEELSKGRGGIVEYEGERVGVYKNEEGETFIVSNHCPHLGCQLEWNPDELSWDCPCHGSRFDYRGNLLDNPAMEGVGDGVLSRHGEE